MANNSGFPSNKNPETTNWEEHGAAGDLSTGRRLKYIQSVPLTFAVDEVSASVTYLGEAKPGIGAGEAFWRITKLTTTGAVTISTYADGNDLFDNVWDNRASLSYS